MSGCLCTSPGLYHDLLPLHLHLRLPIFAVRDLVHDHTGTGPPSSCFPWQDSGRPPGPPIEADDIAPLSLSSPSPTRRIKKRHHNSQAKNENTGTADKTILAEHEYVVEAIVGRREVVRSGSETPVIEYLIKWEGYNSTDNSWEAIDNIFCLDKIEQFEKERIVSHDTEETSSSLETGAENEV